MLNLLDAGIDDQLSRQEIKCERCKVSKSSRAR
jgi:hypothetical protein